MPLPSAYCCPWRDPNREPGVLVRDRLGGNPALLITMCETFRALCDSSGLPYVEHSHTLNRGTHHHRDSSLFFKKQKFSIALAGVAQLPGASSGALKGCRLDTWSGRKPRLGVRSQSGTWREGN